MSDTITLYEKCVHGKLEKHNDPAWPILDDATGEWNPGCPGGRERIFRLEHRCTCYLFEDTDPDDRAHNSWCRVKDDLLVEVDDNE